MCIYIPESVIAMFQLLPFVLIGFVLGFPLGREWERIDQKEKKNGR